jgi:Domain of unknown function (DUF4365)
MIPVTIKHTVKLNYVRRRATLTGSSSKMTFLTNGSPMPLNTRKEEFSYAHIQAVAAVAGFSVQLKSRPMDAAGLDLQIETPGNLPGGVVPFPKIEAQVKSTAASDIINDQAIHYPLEVKNYNKLIHPAPLVPQILIVVLVPVELENWLQITESEMTVRKCAYWQSLGGMAETENTKKVTVSIPRENLLTPDALVQLMTQVAISRGL